MQTFTSLMDFSQSVLFFDFSFQFIILHLLISVCIQFHHLFFFFWLIYNNIYHEKKFFIVPDTALTV
jgi:hypothetical protein